MLFMLQTFQCKTASSLSAAQVNKHLSREGKLPGGLPGMPAGQGEGRCGGQSPLSGELKAYFCLNLIPILTYLSLRRRVKPGKV